MKYTIAALATIISLPAYAQTAQPPPIAANAGFTKEMLGGQLALGLNWFVNAGAHVTQNSDGSVTIAGADGWQWNGQLSTATHPTGSATMCNGTAFGGGGYFEATLSFRGKPAGWYNGANGWPSFWANAVESVYSSIVHNIEVDVMEVMTTDGSFGSGMHNWYEGNNAVNTVSIGQDGTAHTAGTDWSRPHKVGFLWMPGNGTQTLLDDRAVSSQALGPGTPFEQLDQQHLQLYLGSGKENPMTVYDVSVWQNPATADNVCQRGIDGTPGSGLVAKAARSINGLVTTAEDSVQTAVADNGGDPVFAAIQAQIESQSASVAALEREVANQARAPEPQAVATNTAPAANGTVHKQEAPQPPTITTADVPTATGKPASSVVRSAPTVVAPATATREATSAAPFLQEPEQPTVLQAVQQQLVTIQAEQVDIQRQISALEVQVFGASSQSPAVVSDSPNAPVAADQDEADDPLPATSRKRGVARAR